MCSSFGPARYPHDWRCWRNLQTQTCNGGADAHIAVRKRIRCCSGEFLSYIIWTTLHQCCTKYYNKE
jgi:hypothetical protein